MTQPFGATLKHLLESYPDDWLRLVGVPPGGSAEPIDGDVATVSARTDKVFRVSDPSPWLVDLEVQMSFDADLPSNAPVQHALDPPPWPAGAQRGPTLEAESVRTRSDWSITAP